jgi:hypothetical protein
MPKRESRNHCMPFSEIGFAVIESPFDDRYPLLELSRRGCGMG